MAVQVLPLLVAAGALVALSGGKKKTKKSKSGQKCDLEESPPSGYICEEGFLKEEAVDESELDSDNDLSKNDVGDFDTEEEDVGVQDGEEAGEQGGEPDEPEPEPEPDARQLCEEFMATVHVVPTDDDEIPINAVAVEETVLPAMRANAESLADTLGHLDPETVGPVLVVQGLKVLVPVCEWKYNAESDEFTYADGYQIESKESKDVLYGLIKLSLSVIEEINLPQMATLQP